MKKSWILVLFLLISSHMAAFSIQGDISYFRPTASVLRDVYGSAWVDYKLEIEQPLAYQQWFWKRISIFADVSYLSKDGKSTGGGYKTDIQIVPISLGLKWVQPIFDRFNFYLGVAPRYFFLKITNDLSVVRKKITDNGMGSVVMAGFTYNLKNHWYFDLFTSYSFKHFGKPSTPPNVQGESLQVGGLDIGGGLGWKF